MNFDPILFLKNYLNSFHFWYKTKHNESLYNELGADCIKDTTINKCNTLKDIASAYFVETLDILLTYHYIFKRIVPILLLVLAIIFHHNNMVLLILIALTPISFYITYYIRKKYKLTRNRYYFEIQGIYFCMNEKYNINKNVTYEELGRHFTE